MPHSGADGFSHVLGLATHKDVTQQIWELLDEQAQARCLMTTYSMYLLDVSQQELKDLSITYNLRVLLVEVECARLVMQSSPAVWDAYMFGMVERTVTKEPLQNVCCVIQHHLNNLLSSKGKNLDRVLAIEVAAQSSQPPKDLGEVVQSFRNLAGTLDNEIQQCVKMLSSVPPEMDSV